MTLPGFFLENPVMLVNFFLRKPDTFAGDFFVKSGTVVKNFEKYYPVLRKNRKTKKIR
jgi:hypothetical protein